MFVGNAVFGPSTIAPGCTRSETGEIAIRDRDTREIRGNTRKYEKIRGTRPTVGRTLVLHFYQLIVLSFRCRISFQRRNRNPCTPRQPWIRRGGRRWRVRRTPTPRRRRHRGVSARRGCRRTVCPRRRRRRVRRTWPATFQICPWHGRTWKSCSERSRASKCPVRTLHLPTRRRLCRVRSTRGWRCATGMAR